MLRKFALVFAAGATIVAGTAFAPTEASAWYGRCWRCGPYGYYGGRIYYYPRYYPRVYVWRRPAYVYGWRPYYRPYFRPYWGWRRYGW